MKLSELAPLTDPNKIGYKYKEDQILADLKQLIDSSYDEHYKAEDGSDLQCIDAWIAQDGSETYRTLKNLAGKYLWRYGKKDGSNKKDLMKAMHYIVLALYCDHYSTFKRDHS